jgi:hypothetical protein
MLRIIFFILFYTGVFLPLNAQRQDNVWVFGYRFIEDSLANGIFFHFDDSLKIIYRSKPMDFYTTSACISDSSGNLLIYSNGCYIENSEGLEIEGSSGLNPGILYDIFCADDIGYNIPTGMIALPDPVNVTIKHFFHFPIVNNQNSVTQNLLHTSVDLAENGGLGAVITKNTPVVFDTIGLDGIHVVKHANGRDWLILIAKFESNKYYTLVLSPSGVLTQEQSIGVPTSNDTWGKMCFSPDGSKLARFNTRDDLRLFDFDRCTGELSNPVFIPIEDDADNQFYAGLAWSADGHYLYAAEIKRILQFDMWASDVAASMTVVAERAPSPSPNLGFLEIGPNGYIYGNSLGGQRHMHRIKYPERGGLACEVQQSYYEFEYPYINLPHFPNYRLGPLDGSPCDTLGLDNHPLAGWRYDKTGGLGVDFTSVSWYEPETWWWDFGDPASGSSNQTSERNPVHTFSAPGAYEVCLTVSNQYGSDTKCRWVWLNTVSTDSPEARENQIVLYPNPTTGLLQWSGTTGEMVTVRVFDQLGVLAKAQNVNGVQLDLGELPNGLYFVQITGEDGSILTTQKLTLLKH